MATIWQRLRLGEPNSFARRALVGAGWAGAANVLTRAVGFAMGVAATRLLGPEQFGRFALMSTTIASFSTFGALGMGIAAAKLVAQHRAARPEVAGRSLASSVVGSLLAGALVAALLIGFAPLVSTRLLRDPALVDELRIAAVALFFLSWASAQGGGLLGIEAFAAFAKCNVAAAIAQLVFVTAGARWLGLTGAVQGLAAAAALQCALQSLTLRRALAAKGIPASWSGALRELPSAVNVGVPAMLSAGLVLPTLWIGSALLVNHAGFREMAVMYIAEQWFNVVQLIPGIGAQVLLPLMTGVFAQETEAQQATLLRRLSVLHAVVATACLVVLAPASPLILRIYGSSYVGDWPVLAVLIGAGCLAAAVSPAGYALTASGRLWLAFAMNVAWAIAYVAAAYVLVVVNQRGAFGLAWARFAAYGLHAIWSVAYLRALILRPQRAVPLG